MLKSIHTDHWCRTTTVSETDAIQEMLDRIINTDEPSHDDIEKVKASVVKQVQLNRIPRNSELLRSLPHEHRERLLPKLQLKRVRSVSGVTVISVMSRPRGCPHGRCAYCPMERNVPLSYTGREPAAMRARQHAYDPHDQIVGRLTQLRAIGHTPSKVELIIQGGTFPAAPAEYQMNFVKRCLDALNGIDASSLEEAKLIAETSTIRNVGLTIETKPDWAKQSHADLMLQLGATRVEIGVQTIDDGIYTLVNRGHTVEDVRESFRVMKDAAFKIVAHMMPGLPGADFEKDLTAFRSLFEDPDFRPDMLKIYPCLVLRGTRVYEWWQRGDYVPYTTEQAAELISRVKEFVPPWLRIMRVQREIPAELIVAGPDKGNLRELAQVRLRTRGLRCRCIRCREVGHRQMKENKTPNPEAVRILTDEYEASEGTELFISEEDTSQDILIGYLRLRIPSERAHRPEIRFHGAGLVREVHVYGPAVPVGKSDSRAWQHKGVGARLLAEAERVAHEEFGRRKMQVISALGTKQYYARFGYRHDGPYVSKQLA